MMVMESLKRRKLKAEFAQPSADSSPKTGLRMATEWTAQRNLVEKINMISNHSGYLKR